MPTPEEKVLVTGAAGFIGFHLSQRLINDGYQVVGLDNLNSYYDVALKKARLKILEKRESFSFYKDELSDKATVAKIFEKEKFDIVINLAAQAGVRYSLKNPQAYIDSNITGFLNVLEGCRHNEVGHLIYASSSSVYGANTKMPFSTKDNVDHPISLYAATKKSNELMAHTYATLYGIPTTGLRFFTVYGPWGRPDMALFLFTKAILEGHAIDVYNNGKMKRDFTYIDDIVEGIFRLLHKAPKANDAWNGKSPDPSLSFGPYQLFNIGNSEPVELLHFIDVLEKKLGKIAQKNFLPIQKGDVESTFADVSGLKRAVDYAPSTTVEVGIERFVDWYKDYYKIR